MARQGVQVQVAREQAAWQLGAELLGEGARPLFLVGMVFVDSRFQLLVPLDRQEKQWACGYTYKFVGAECAELRVDKIADVPSGVEGEHGCHRDVECSGNAFALEEDV